MAARARSAREMEDGRTGERRTENGWREGIKIGRQEGKTDWRGRDLFGAAREGQRKTDRERKDDTTKSGQG